MGGAAHPPSRRIYKPPRNLRRHNAPQPRYNHPLQPHPQQKDPKMRGLCGVVAVAMLLLCCSADSRQEQDGSLGEHNSADRYDANGHKTRNLDPLGGGNMVRDLRDSRRYGLILQAPRRLDYGSPFGYRRGLWPLGADYGSLDDGLAKRNFDEIDRSGLDPFVGKRNFDEIDQTSMPFPYAKKRYFHFLGPNTFDRSNFDQKRYRPEFPMDEIDLSHFPIGSKRSLDSYAFAPRV